MKKANLSHIAHFTFWLSYFAINAIGQANFIPLDRAILHAGLVVSLLAGLFYLNAFWLVNRYFEKKQYWRFAGWSLVIFVIFYSIRYRVEVPYFEDFFEAYSRGNERQVKGLVLFTVLLTMLLSTLIQLLANRMRKERLNQELLNQHQEAQLQFLKAQINPHFLFNTLNNIYALAITRSTQTSAMILKLSDLLRYVIYESKKQEVLLSGEIEQIQQYIELFQMKSESPLQVNFTVEGTINNVFIEPMILIPLVENCFKHCDFDSNPNAFVEIRLKMDTQQLTFSTQNSKNNANQQKDKTGGVGLDNIRKRLELNRPGQHTLTIDQEAQLFNVKLELIYGKD